MEEQDVCPICFEEYKNPKLLPCRHTFCANCIERLLATKTENSTFLCPNCRVEIKLPPGGAHAFVSNYFIHSWPEKRYCEICECECKGRCLTCQTCMRKTCPSCFRAHGEEKGCNHSDEIPEIPGILHRQLLDTRSNVHTAYEAKLIASFQHDQVEQVAKMVHSSSREQIWIADNYRNELAEYDRSGTKTKCIPVNGRIIDFCTYIGNSLLVTKENSRVVMKVTTSEESVFIRQSRDYPKYVTCMKQGMVAVAINNHAHDTFSLFYYSSDGARLMEYEHEPFRHISGLCFNTVHNQVCISDRQFGYLFMASPGGKLYTYPGRKRMWFPVVEGRRAYRSQNIVPLCVTCDADGNTFLFDDISGLIHIVDKTANLVAMMDTDESYFVQANQIAFSCSHQLWVSDTQDRRIKVYNVQSCVNYLGFVQKEDSNATFTALGGNRISSEALENTDASDVMQRNNVIYVPSDIFENGQNFYIERNEYNNPTRIILVPIRRGSSSRIENCPLPPPRDKSH